MKLNIKEVNNINELKKALENKMYLKTFKLQLLFMHLIKTIELFFKDAVWGAEMKGSN